MPTDVESLKQAGLTDYEVRTYLALLKFGSLGGQDCSKQSGVPPTRVYAALWSLIEKGLASKLRDKPLLFKAISPEIGLKHLFEKKAQIIKSIGSEAIKSLKTIKAKPILKPMIREKLEVILGFEQMYSYFVNLVNKAQKEILVFSIGEKVPYPVALATKKAVARGIIPKLIVIKCDNENKAILEERKKEGWQVKHYAGVGDFTFSVIDGKIAMLNVRNPQEKEERISIFFEVPELAKHLKAYFESLWEKAKAI